jgi:hypothetical protein
MANYESKGFALRQSISKFDGASALVVLVNCAFGNVELGGMFCAENESPLLGTGRGGRVRVDAAHLAGRTPHLHPLPFAKGRGGISSLGKLPTQRNDFGPLV